MKIRWAQAVFLASSLACAATAHAGTFDLGGFQIQVGEKQAATDGDEASGQEQEGGTVDKPEQTPAGTVGVGDAGQTQSGQDDSTGTAEAAGASTDGAVQKEAFSEGTAEIGQTAEVQAAAGQAAEGQASEQTVGDQQVTEDLGMGMSGQESQGEGNVEGDSAPLQAGEASDVYSQQAEGNGVTTFSDASQESGGQGVLQSQVQSSGQVQLANQAQASGQTQEEALGQVQSQAQSQVQSQGESQVQSQGESQVTQKGQETKGAEEEGSTGESLEEHTEAAIGISEGGKALSPESGGEGKDSKQQGEHAVGQGIQGVSLLHEECTRLAAGDIPSVRLRGEQEVCVLSFAVNHRECAYRWEGSLLLPVDPPLCKGVNCLEVSVLLQGGGVISMDPWYFSCGVGSAML